MCGIVGYIGHQDAYPILLKGLKRLEYRGYDSAGVALLNGDLNIYKRKGKVNNLELFTEGKNKNGSVGIGHTRWATHGKPDDINAHPHLSGNGRLALIHNGIIENYATLKEALLKLGHTFISETDTEVLVHLIEEIQSSENLELDEAVRIALTKVIGAYAIVVIDKLNPDILVAARKGSPLVVGLGENEYFIGSDATPIIDYTKKVIYLQDEEIAIIKNGRLQIKDIRNEVKNPKVELLDMQIEALEKSGYDYFMLKEIHQQPETVLDCMRGRLNAEESWIHLRGVEEYEEKFRNVQKLNIVSCGTSWHAGLIGEYLIEDLARLPVEVEYASEFRYRNPIIGPDDIVIALSQSGETADTLAALELSKERRALTYGIVNVVGSSIARTTHAGSYIHAGPEIGVASTKAFTGQVTLLTLMALKLASARGTISKSRFQELVVELEKIPGKIQKVLEKSDQIKYIASEIKDSTNAIYLGRGVNFPVALEGALKLKEISYIHAEGYPAAEMKHGPIALIDEKMPVIVIATNKNAYDKIVSNVQEVKARKGIVISIVCEGDVEIAKLSDYFIEIPETEDPLTPLLSVIPLQLLSYHIALMRGCDVDQPRNLAKSVTVE
ncbi:MAG: glutamine--fructose-6-phosphate transaminase (isomerizing) [Saprospiraceae bacterium]|jgi:glucosamine--fructose-6-phosphate aminotransferase (isomerizing)|uniref:glutamine--fructose-6-phosphate transaminase (isomerizing) n=1 Tax=Candidatus Brachybacter algidus TaxID=2982024 RepID=UPI001B6E9858|nr:glutamine--fructose-6-phosphate transaminase (isomerizing) [Candidatus Brachybacter algidus]MBP7305996.1 glutamine--fructose-6-phosphate transaminase (isomerizing) [Saprospiraceae bacterium]MBK6372128.1 glutamine--fructose-6-phosphate transaminase (isomerizing) [Candidatus Brachybacter algidus]MBK6448549.1 glutamine--fructose-6-phosphate transaminase (isomerizing) [Candidatus Brachybacter algidus]MBK7603458.1 glutamine--fructose-6-phosphate transaminase (isomerizing) [Candidatus Brachybacter